MSLLYTPPQAGDFLPYVKYNAKAGRWYVKKDGSEVEVQNPVFVADLANAKRAWMHFQEGQAPNVVYFPSLEAQIPQPTPNHKVGVSINLFSPSMFGGVVKMESNSINTCTAVSKLYQAYCDAPEKNTGKLPVVKVTGATPVKGNFGTNYEPVFVIEKWVDRPSTFDEAESATQAPAQAQAQQPVVQSSVSEF